MKRLIVAALSAVAASPVTAQGNAGGWHSHMMYGDGYGFMGFVMMLLLFAAIVAVALVVWRALGQGKPGAQADSALEVLHQRLAKGEIDPAEFEARRKVLEN